MTMLFPTIVEKTASDRTNRARLDMQPSYQNRSGAGEGTLRHLPGEIFYSLADDRVAVEEISVACSDPVIGPSAVVKLILLPKILSAYRYLAMFNVQAALCILKADGWVAVPLPTNREP
jgi:hypothetical protein